jgi:hypothetical protein
MTIGAGQKIYMPLVTGMGPCEAVPARVPASPALGEWGSWSVA